MRFLAPAIVLICLITNCAAPPANTEKVKAEVMAAEKAFEKMCAEKSIAEAFAHFADAQAVIKRTNDTLISGPENIRQFYSKSFYQTATVAWTPDFIDVSEKGDMAWTYGKYLWKSTDSTGVVSEFRGVFHTVWKRQADGSWKYVWD